MFKLKNKVVFVNGRRTSMSMLPKEWNAFDEVCGLEGVSRNELLSLIERVKCKKAGLTPSTRLFVISYFRYRFSYPFENALNLRQIITLALRDNV